VRRRRLTLLAALHAAHPELDEPAEAIRAGRIEVGGLVVTNPDSLIDATASVRLAEPRRLRGELKLGPALRELGVSVGGRIALDIGAAAGGFTKALLEAGATRVYAVDVGHGQLLGSLRQDDRVVDLEATNLAELGPTLVPEPIEVVTVDVSYLSLAEAVPQLERVSFALDADLVALVKPMFELRLGELPPAERLSEAVERAVAGIEAAGWRINRTMPSPVRGAHDAAEFFAHARRARQASRP
jgi:23S rRNA (cytidine1920-2'-O)/16S rRNA (cytidine1409-2'-O)-methyltransferase